MNWLYFASEVGGIWASMLLGIYQTCCLQQIDALTYLQVIMSSCIVSDVDPVIQTPTAYALMRRNTNAA